MSSLSRIHHARITQFRVQKYKKIIKYTNFGTEILQIIKICNKNKHK